MNAVRLVVWKESERIQDCEFKGEGYLGRESVCALQLDDRAISRKQAFLRVIEGGQALELVNQSDFAPILVNGIKKMNAVLKHGDAMEVGPFRVVVEELEKNSSKEEPQDKSIEVVETRTMDTDVESRLDDEPLDGTQIQSYEEEPEATKESSEEQPITPFEDLKVDGTRVMEVDSSALSMALEMDHAKSPVPPPIDKLPNPGHTVSDSIPRDDQQHSIQIPGQDAGTEIVTSSHVSAQLIFPQGSASPNIIQIQDKDIVIGRSASCDVVIRDKKSSRKNSSIRREGARFKIKDLDSVNGTYLNGKRITEANLSGDDQIQIGDVVFHIRIVDRGYQESAREADLDDQLNSDVTGQVPSLPFEYGSAPQEEDQPYPNLPGSQAMPASDFGGAQPLHPPSNQNKSLMVKFRALPQWKQAILGMAFLAFFWWFLEDEEVPIQVSQKKTTTAQTAPKPEGETQVPGAPKAALGFEILTPEKKRFVETQHQLAFDLYRNKEYDKAIFEIRKIFSVVPDYKDSKEIERYAIEGKKKLDLLEEERRKKEEEARARAEILSLESKIQGLVDKKKFDSAMKLFPDILSLDPENQKVLKWQGEIEAFETEKREKEEKRLLQEAINRDAWELYAQSLRLFRSGEFLGARKAFQKVLKRGATDKRLIGFAKDKVRESDEAWSSQLEKMITEAREAEKNGMTSKAFGLYEKIADLDPSRAIEAEEGMKRIQTGIDDKAKVIYTEAVLAESFSDFETAKVRFKKILETTPENNLYHQRAKAKLGRYLAFEATPPEEEKPNEP